MKIALQMCNVRDFLAKDFEGTHKRVKEIGYDYVEVAGYYDKTAEEYRKVLDDCGLECVSVHQVADEFLNKGQEAVDYIKTLGAKFCAIPWYDIKMYHSDFNGAIEKYKKIGKMFKDNKMQLLYHNHGFDFEEINGEFIIDKIFKEVPDDLIQPQLDVCWIHYPGQNPIDYIEKYSGRIKTLHLKDFVCKNLPQKPLFDPEIRKIMKPTTEENGFEYRNLGDGIQDINGIVKAAEKAGVEYLIVEQDFPTYDSLKDAENSINYLKRIGV